MKYFFSILKWLALIILVYVSISFLRSSYEAIWLKKYYYDSNDVANWADHLGKRVDLEKIFDQKYETKLIKQKNKEDLLLSPLGKYKFEYIHCDPPYTNAVKGFLIYDAKTNNKIFEVNHFLMCPEYVKWIFDEHYIIYQTYEPDFWGDQMPEIYMGNLRNGKLWHVTSGVNN